MSNRHDAGGSAAHDIRREGTVTPREHNLRRSTDGGTAEKKLADPNLPHSSPSAREERRAEKRAAREEETEQAEG